jgi:hypothetical protein
MVAGSLIPAALITEVTLLNLSPRYFSRSFHESGFVTSA